MSDKKLLSANEAVAYGAAQAGCVVASAYPGTPSTEILENIAKFKDTVKCEWAVNEKVAMEMIAVPCWSSWKTGMPIRFFRVVSTSKPRARPSRPRT